MFEKAFILAGSITAIISSNTDVAFDEGDMSALQAHIPQLVELKQIPEEPNLRITHFEANTFSLSQSDSQVILKEKWGARFSTDIPHLLYGMARHYWLNNGLFVIHSSCVGNEKDGFVLLVGQSGSGKTSTALECVRKLGLEIFSGDKTVIEVDNDANLWAIGGTKVLTSRLPDGERWLEMVEKSIQTTARHTFRLKSEHYSNSKKVPIKAVVILSLNDGREICEEFSSISAVHNLYPFFMDSQREDVLLNDGNFVFDGTIRRQVKQKHVPRLTCGIKKIRTLRVVGSMDYVTQAVANLFKERML